MNLIRVYEIDLEDLPGARASQCGHGVVRAVRHQRLVPDTETEQLALAASPSIDIVRLLFKLRARELYDRIEVLSEPKALQLFRERVHDTWLMNNCSTTRCHGGTGAGRFSLQRARSTDDRTRYTNLLMIDRFRCDDGASLVDWDDPPSSRLIQYGLPADQTNTPHPDVPGWKPVFGGSQRALAKGAELWIGSMRSTPRPVYPVGEWLIPAPPPEPASPADAWSPRTPMRHRPPEPGPSHPTPHTGTFVPGPHGPLCSRERRPCPLIACFDGSPLA